MLVRLTADGTTKAGGTPLVQHCERLNDPLDSFNRAIATLTAKRKKTEADHREIARLEFFGGAYSDPPLECARDFSVHINGHIPGIPAANVFRCLQDGATRLKRGRDVPRGVYVLPTEQFAPLEYEGPKSLQALWEDGGFELRKSVGINQRRVVRTRPIFADWKLSVTFEIDPEIWDLDTLTTAWELAGRYCGLGDMRPIHGRFAGSLAEVKS